MKITTLRLILIDETIDITHAVYLDTVSIYTLHLQSLIVINIHFYERIF